MYHVHSLPPFVTELQILCARYLEERKGGELSILGPSIKADRVEWSLCIYRACLEGVKGGKKRGVGLKGARSNRRRKKGGSEQREPG